ncbi:DUF2304 family protein [Thermococcus sp. CX2]|uniref:DUF2304 domain-containing protein n=1 Tax=Thermococcus sp. CX2 TaxID=163006 RepID=UPI001438B64C|nr:DUF2304 family protein [Thermococcus sp. CX2]NJE85189.1 DUF2304 family protein [Thermococcus sp. CX2]
MYAIQYITIVVVLASMVYVLGRYGRREFEWEDFLFWEALLLGLLIVAIFPVEIANEIKRILGLGRGFDALFVIGIGLGYILIFRVYLAVDKTEREITELTRKLAIELEEMNKRLEKIEEKL